MVDRFRRLERDQFDVIVIGAGISGLTAAALLARRGRSVLVVDRHYVAGGNATVFKRPGYEFDIGIHYLGQCGNGGTIPHILEAAGAARVDFRPLDPEGFDTLAFPDFELRVPRGAERYRERLLELFPDERRAIDDNLKVIGHVAAMISRPITGPLDGLRALPHFAWMATHAGTTLGRFLARRTNDPRLVAALAGEGGDYALPPSRVALPMHAGLMAHYLMDGAYYPAGGGQIMSDRLAESIERSGGKILLSTRARRILVERGRARGVTIENKHLGKLDVRADTVIASSDIKRVIGELLPPEVVKEKTRERARRWEMAPALGALYLGVRREALGDRTANTNYWIYSGYDLEAEYGVTRSGRFSEQPFAFVSLASLKDPDNPRIAPPGIVNLQVMGLAPSEPEAWGVDGGELESGEYRESARYQEIKARYEETLLRSAERVFPDLSRHIVFRELATPLTHSRYTLSSGGTSYGLAATPEQILWRRPGPKSEIAGLYLCGASTLAGHGIMGSMTGGVLAAASIAGMSLMAEAMGGAGVKSLPAPARALEARLGDAE